MKTKLAQDLIRMAKKLVAVGSPMDDYSPARDLNNTLDAIEKGVKSLRFSVEKYMLDTGKYAPQLENVAQISHEVERALQRLARVASGLMSKKTAAPDAGHPMVSGSPEFIAVRKALETYELARNPDTRVRKLFSAVVSILEANEAAKSKAARARQTPKLAEASMPPVLRRLLGTVHTARIDEQAGKVMVTFSTEKAANAFEAKAKALLGLDDEDEAATSKYDVSGSMNPKTGKYTITIEY